MNTLREEIVHRSPKIVSNLFLALIFWVIRYLLLITLPPFREELIFLLQMGLLIVTGIFLVRALFNALTVFDMLTGSFLKRLGITEGWSRQRVLKDIICIVAVLLVAAALFPLFNSMTNSVELIQQGTTYVALGLIFLFVFDIGRSFYRLTEQKANSVADMLSNSINGDEEIDEQ